MPPSSQFPSGSQMAPRSSAVFCDTVFNERKFGVYKRRKHHCRFCGRICCRYCCAYRLDMERCCDGCMRHYQDYYLQFRENGGEVNPLSSVSIMVNCRVEWNADDGVGRLAVFGHSKQRPLEPLEENCDASSSPDNRNSGREEPELGVRGQTGRTTVAVVLAAKRWQRLSGLSPVSIWIRR